MTPCDWQRNHFNVRTGLVAEGIRQKSDEVVGATHGWLNGITSMDDDSGYRRHMPHAISPAWVSMCMMRWVFTGTGTGNGADSKDQAFTCRMKVSALGSKTIF